MLSLGLSLPYSGFDKPYDSWTAQLITRGDWKQADEVVKRGLRATSNDRLLALQAMILAERGEFDEALKVQQKSGCQQRQPCQFCEYWGLGDLLLFKGKPDLAAKSFGLNNKALSSGREAEWQRCVLAQAL